MTAKTFDKRLEAEITLDYPIKVEGVEYKSLKMRRPKAKDSLKAASYKGGEAKRGILLLADLCGVAPDVIEELDEIDADKLGEQYTAFTGRQAE